MLRKYCGMALVVMGLGAACFALSGCGGASKANPSRIYMRTINLPAATTQADNEEQPSALNERVVKLEFFDPAQSLTEPSLVKSYEIAPEQTQVVVNGLEQGITYQVKGYIFAGEDSGPIQIFETETER